MVFQKVAIWLLNSIFSTPIAPKLLLFTFIKQHFGFGGTNIHSEILLLCLVFVNFDKQILSQPGAIWEGGRVRPKKFVTIGNRISHDHSWGSEVTEGLLKGHYFFAPFPQSQRMQFTHLIRHKLTLFGRGPDRKWTTLNGVTLAILWVPKMALRLQSKFRDNFLIQTSPPNPQKDTLGSRIGPKKTSKLFPRHFYC